MPHEIAVILDDMHGALLRGELARLAELAPALQAANPQTLTAAEAQRIRKQAQRNALCLDAAMSGVKSARRRLADIADAAKGLTTYDKTGVRATLPLAPAKPRRV